MKQQEGKEGRLEGTGAVTRVTATLGVLGYADFVHTLSLKSILTIQLSKS